MWVSGKLINNYCSLGRTFRYTISFSTLGWPARNALLILLLRTVDYSPEQCLFIWFFIESGARMHVLCVTKLSLERCNILVYTHHNRPKKVDHQSPVW